MNYKNFRPSLLQYLFMKWLVIILILAAATDVILTLSSYISPRKNKVLVNTPITEKVIYDLNDPFTEKKVKDYLIQLHVKYPDVAIAQMKLESANGTSKIFNECNNLFGMKVAVRRPTTALGEKDGHAYYSHWRQSCIDFAIWQSFVEDPENIYSEASWVDYISRIYSKDSSYKVKLLFIRRNLYGKNRKSSD